VEVFADTLATLLRRDGLWFTVLFTQNGEFVFFKI